MALLGLRSGRLRVALQPDTHNRQGRSKEKPLALEIHHFTCLSDNFGVLLHEPQSGVTASIDAPEAGPIEAALHEKGWKLTHILVTHHHDDHVGGIAPLKERWQALVVGNAHDAARIPGLDRQVEPGGVFDFAGHRAEIIDTPGHTVGHIAWHFPADRLLFAGDTLFALGCGRVFEGTHAQMWASLEKLAGLPPETSVHCGHEYTQSNARFALTVDPQNAKLKQRAKEIDVLRTAGRATLPTTIGLELQTNPFLRPGDPNIRRTLGMEDASDEAVFSEIRKRKDRF
jgi:hydroxyacylglutathione hydrolase